MNEQTITKNNNLSLNDQLCGLWSVELFFFLLPIAQRKLDIFDCHNIDFGNQKHCFWKSKICKKKLCLRLQPIQCDEPNLGG